MDKYEIVKGDEEQKYHFALWMRFVEQYGK